MQFGETHPSANNPQTHKLSIRKSKELMQQSKMLGTASLLNSTRETQPTQNMFMKRSELTQLTSEEKFIFNSAKMEVSYGCGCL